MQTDLLLTKYSFTVPAKVLYAKDIIKGQCLGWSSRLYLYHLEKWNGFFEADPPKSEPWHFQNQFVNLVLDMKVGKFDWERSPIPTFEGRICNGRHRLAAALALEVRDVPTIESEGPCDCDQAYFEAFGVEEWFSDVMGTEFCVLKPNARIAVVYGAHNLPIEDVLGPVFYKRSVMLNGLGVFNLIRELYHGESWLDTSGWWKAEACGAGLVTFYVIDTDGRDMREAKEKLRAMYGGQHSIHTSDTHEDTVRIARAVFNYNGIHFLNHAQVASVDAASYGDERPADSGSVLAVYGLRGTNDLDFVDEFMHFEHHGVSLDDLTNNPHYFFWARGVKYCSIQQVLRMKQARNEPKDRADIALIRGL